MSWQRTLFSAFLSASLFCLTQATPPAPAAGMHGESPRVRLAYDGRQPPALHRPDLQVLPGQAAPLVDYSWTDLTFVSYRDSNWEIYRGNADGSGQTRLSNHIGRDIHPRFSRGASRVAFASERDGDFEIFSIKPDGSGLTQLTFNKSDDVYPAWSPDGKKLAFQSSRDGQAEVYLMNADGSGQIRLTYSGDYDGMPTWSPDGKQLAFISRRGGLYRVYTMNLDGSNQEQISYYAYAENPSYSPDGRYLAYDADSDNDGFQELRRIDLQAGNHDQLVYDPGGVYDALAGSFAPDGTIIAYTLAEWLYDGGVWYWVTAKLYARDADPDDGVSYPLIQLSPGEKDWAVDWQTRDTDAPRSWVMALPPFSRANGFTVNWVGQDDGGAGIKSFDVQQSLGTSNSWSNWMSGTTQSSQIFSGVPGTRLYLRSKALDQAYNDESWSSGADTETVLYRWKLATTTFDSRGFPLAGGVFAVEPAALNPGMRSDANGLGELYLLEMQAQVSFSQTGYGALPPVSYSGDADQAAWWLMPPLADLLTNGSFESGNLAGWNSTPQGMTLASEFQAHSGTYAARLGNRYEVQVEDFTSAANFCTLTEVDRGTDGTLHVLFTRREGSNGGPASDCNVFYTRRPPGESWSNPELVSSINDENAQDIDLAVSGDGRVYAIWADGEPASMINYRLASRPAGGSWGAPELLHSEQINTNDLDHVVQVEVSSTNVLHVVFHGYHRSRIMDGEWSAPVEFFSHNDRNVDMEIGPDDVVHFAYVGDPVGMSTLYAVTHTTLRPNGVWDFKESSIATTSTALDVRLAVSPLNVVFMIWVDNSGEQFVMRPAGGSWLATETLAPANTVNQHEISANAVGQLHLLRWSSGENYLVRLADGRWMPPHTLDLAGAYNFTLSSEAANLADVFLLEQHVQIMTHLEAQSGLEQGISLPEDLHAPTLSFVYQLSDPGGEGGLRLLVNDVPAWECSQSTSGWQHAWLDLSPWLGQTVILRWEADHPDPAQNMQAWIEEVSVGAWLTPLVNGVEPQSLTGWSNAMVMIQGENFMEGAVVQVGGVPSPQVTWESEQSLMAQVPPGLPAGMHAVWVSNPGGQAGGWAGQLVLGHWVYIPLLGR